MNSIKRKVFLYNISNLCLAISAFVKNCYAIQARLFVIGGTETISNEGTTQLDPVAVASYALGITPLIMMLMMMMMMMIKQISTKCDNIKMVAFTGDFTAAAKFQPLLQWWITLFKREPKFGYFPKPTKSWLITKFETYGLERNFYKIPKFG